MTSTTFPNLNDHHQPSGWRVIVCFVLAVLTLGSANRLQAAGCQHATASQTAQAAGQLDSALLGKWQYVGGQIFYQFHLAPIPCDGPGCRQAPEPETEMAVIPQSPERSTVPAFNQTPAWQFGSMARSAWRIEDHFASSPTLSGMLRPPCCG